MLRGALTCSINAQSTLKTNIPHFGFEERKTNYEISTTNRYKKFTLKYQQEDDGTKVVDISAPQNLILNNGLHMRTCEKALESNVDISAPQNLIGLHFFGL